MEHYEFISKTDNKSLYNQIKYLVSSAQQSYQNDLTTRRKHLKELLDADEKIYENEFIDKMKSRVDENIRERQKSLLALKMERTKEIEKFVASKKLHKNMENCIEIREELRRKDYRDAQLCQLEQMDDRLRAIAKEKKDDQFWIDVQNRIANDYDRKQQNEETLKRALQANQCRILNQQLEEKRRMREMDLEHFNKEKAALKLKMDASEREEIRRARAEKIARSKDMQLALSTIVKQKELLDDEAKTFEEVFHRETIRQVKIEMDEAMRKNEGVKEAVLDYLNYVKKFKAFASDLDRRREETCDEMRQRFSCYKELPKKKILQMKQQTAQSAHKTLLKQICEEQARRMQLEAYERENKIIENRFARLEMRDKVKEREKIKSDLDLQLEEIARLNVEKQKKFEEDLNRAQEDRILCEELLERHKADGCDYLTPHPNWKLLSCYPKGNCKRDGRGDGQ